MQRIAIDARAALTDLISQRFPGVASEWRGNLFIVTAEIQQGQKFKRGQTVIEYARVEDLHMPKIQSTIPARKDLSAAIVEYSQVLRAKLLDFEAEAAITAQQRAALEAELSGSAEASARKAARAAKA